MRSVLRRQAHDELERRQAYIQGYSFPSALRERINEHYDPALTSPQLSTVFEGLRDWFSFCLLAEGKTLGMPSSAVDVAWHEFILMTREYHAFCEEAFGYYLHHSPESTMSEPMPEALRRTAKLALRRRNALDPPGVPILFAVDSELGLADGMVWTREDVERLANSKDAGAGAGSYGAGSCGGDAGGGSCGGGGCGGG